jgi:hypothetical protein
MAGNRNPLFEWTGPAVAMRFGLGALLGLLLGVLVLAVVLCFGRWSLATGTTFTVLLVGTPAACGVLGVFALRQVAQLVGQVYEDVVR